MSEDTCTVCGGRVHEAEEITTVQDGETYRFCSDEHKEQFEALSGQYA